MNKDYVVDILAMFGVAFIIAGLGTAVLLIYSFLRDFIADKRYKYKIAHRFDKKPIAECYCKDCLEWTNNFCNRYESYMADCGFCWRAEPKKRKKIGKLMNKDYVSRQYLRNVMQGWYQEVIKNECAV